MGVFFFQEHYFTCSIKFKVALYIQQMPLLFGPIHARTDFTTHSSDSEAESERADLRTAAAWTQEKEVRPEVSGPRLLPGAPSRYSDPNEHTTSASFKTKMVSVNQCSLQQTKTLDVFAAFLTLTELCVLYICTAGSVEYCEDTCCKIKHLLIPTTASD